MVRKCFSGLQICVLLVALLRRGTPLTGRRRRSLALSRTATTPRGPLLFRLRGGEDDDDDLDDDDDDEDDFFDDEDLEEAVDEADFEGETLKARAMKAWRTTPPLTQIYVATSAALTTTFFLLNNNVWPKWMHLDWRQTFRGQLWYGVVWRQ